MLEVLFLDLLDAFKIRRGFGVLPPYYSAKQSLEGVFGLAEEETDNPSNFRGSSYVLEPLVFALARRGRRELIEEHWARYSRIAVEEFIPKRAIDVLLWHGEDGVNSTRFPNQTQSWTALLESATDATGVPKELRTDLDFLPFLLLVYPHRIRGAIVNAIEGGKFTEKSQRKSHQRVSSKKKLPRKKSKKK